MKDAQHTIGTILESDMGRDAIHVAMAPVVARMVLQPGQHVGIDGDTTNPVGIVDPFLKGSVFTGQRFWLLLYPNTITSLRHEWTHPAFTATAAGGHESREWIRAFAERYGFTLEQILDAARDYLSHGDYLAGGDLLDGESVPDEFWDHYGRATGTTVDPLDRGSFFTCGC